MKNKDLDKLFQEAADKASFSDSAAGWSGMKSKLQNGGLVADSKPKFRINLNSLILLLLFLLPVLTATWFFLEKDLGSNSDVSLNEENLGDTNYDIIDTDEKKVSIDSNSIVPNIVEGGSENESFDEPITLESQKSKSNPNSLAETALNNDLLIEQTPVFETDNNQKYANTETEQEELKAKDRPIRPTRESAQQSLLINEVKINKRTEKDSSNVSFRNSDVSFENNSDIVASRELRLTKTYDERSKEPSSNPSKTDDSSDSELEKTSIIEQERTYQEEFLHDGQQIGYLQAREIEPHRLMPYQLQRKEAHLAQLKTPRPTTIKGIEVSTNVVQAEIETIQDSITGKRSRWSFGIEFSPDLSSVGLGGYEDLGYTIGAQVEYHRSSKLSITGGIGYSKKIYFADEGIESYPGTNPNWTVNRVNADCDVLDIPFNLSYYLSGYEESGFVFSTGISSYIMLTEDYDVIYNDPFPEGSQFIRNENNHFFGLINASFGYRKKLSPILSLQVEPYIKIPIQGIGEGGLDLFTSGFRLAFKYNKLTINN